MAIHWSLILTWLLCFHRRGEKKHKKVQQKMFAPIGCPMGVMSCYPSANILFLCHSISILKQTMSELNEKGLKANFIQGKEREIKKGINVASIQTFAKINPDKYDIFFDCIIVDECHHVISKTSQYGKILQKMFAPMKIGLTATLPEGTEKILSMKGLLGNVIYENVAVWHAVFRRY